MKNIIIGLPIKEIKEAWKGYEKHGTLQFTAPEETLTYTIVSYEDAEDLYFLGRSLGRRQMSKATREVNKEDKPF